MEGGGAGRTCARCQVHAVQFHFLVTALCAAGEWGRGRREYDCLKCKFIEGQPHARGFWFSGILGFYWGLAILAVLATFIHSFTYSFNGTIMHSFIHSIIRANRVPTCSGAEPLSLIFSHRSHVALHAEGSKGSPKCASSCTRRHSTCSSAYMTWAKMWAQSHA